MKTEEKNFESLVNMMKNTKIGTHNTKNGSIGKDTKQTEDLNVDVDLTDLKIEEKLAQHNEGNTNKRLVGDNKEVHDSRTPETDTSSNIRVRQVSRKSPIDMVNDIDEPKSTRGISDSGLDTDSTDKERQTSDPEGVEHSMGVVTAEAQKDAEMSNPQVKTHLSTDIQNITESFSKSIDLATIRTNNGVNSVKKEKVEMKDSDQIAEAVELSQSNIEDTDKSEESDRALTEDQTPTSRTITHTDKVKGQIYKDSVPLDGRAPIGSVATHYGPDSCTYPSSGYTFNQTDPNNRPFNWVCPVPQEAPLAQAVPEAFKNPASCQFTGVNSCQAGQKHARDPEFNIIPTKFMAPNNVQAVVQQYNSQQKQKQPVEHIDLPYLVSQQFPSSSASAMSGGLATEQDKVLQDEISRLEENLAEPGPAGSSPGVQHPGIMQSQVPSSSRPILQAKRPTQTLPARPPMSAQQQHALYQQLSHSQQSQVIPPCQLGPYTTHQTTLSAQQQPVFTQQQTVPATQQQQVMSQQQAMSPQQQIMSQQQAVSPQQQMMSQQQAMSPQQQMMSLQQIMSPQQQAMSPKQQMMSKQQAMSPQQQMVSQQQMRSPRQQAMSPQQQMSPQQPVMSPQQQAMSPCQQTMSPQQQTMSPRQQTKSPRQQTMSQHQEAYTSQVALSPPQQDLSRQYVQSNSPQAMSPQQAYSPQATMSQAPPSVSSGYGSQSDPPALSDPSVSYMHETMLHHPDQLAKPPSLRADSPDSLGDLASSGSSGVFSPPSVITEADTILSDLGLEQTLEPFQLIPSPADIPCFEEELHKFENILENTVGQKRSSHNSNSDELDDLNEIIQNDWKQILPVPVEAEPSVDPPRAKYPGAPLEDKIQEIMGKQTPIRPKKDPFILNTPMPTPASLFHPVAVPVQQPAQEVPREPSVSEKNDEQADKALSYVSNIPTKDLQSVDEDKDNLIHIIAEAHQYYILKALLARMYRDNILEEFLNATNSDSRTPLYTAMTSLPEKGQPNMQVKMIRELVEYGADVNVQCCHGRMNSGLEPLYQSALHLAASLCRAHLLEILLKGRGAKVNLQNTAQDTPLHCAVRKHGVKYDGQERDSRDVIKVLVSHGADLGAKAKAGKTIVHMIAENKWDENLLSFVLNQIPPTRLPEIINAKDDGGNTALHLLLGWSQRLNAYRTKEMMISMIKIMMKNCADPKLKDSRNRTPQQFAGGDRELLDLLAKKNSRENSRSQRNSSSRSSPEMAPPVAPLPAPMVLQPVPTMIPRFNYPLTAPMPHGFQ